MSAAELFMFFGFVVAAYSIVANDASVCSLIFSNIFSFKS